jgi:hypothetical protein
MRSGALYHDDEEADNTRSTSGDVAGRSERDERERRLFDMQAHKQAWLEHDHPSGWHWDFFTGFRISTSARRALLDFEDSEVPQFDGFAALEAFDDVMEGALQDSLDVHLRKPGFFGNGNDDLFLGQRHVERYGNTGTMVLSIT